MTKFTILFRFHTQVIIFRKFEKPVFETDSSQKKLVFKNCFFTENQFFKKKQIFQKKQFFFETSFFSFYFW